MISVMPPLITAVVGALAGYWFALRRYGKEQQMEFIRQQVTQLYSPMVGCIKRIRACGELRLELSKASDIAWHKICEENPKPFHNHEKHFEPFKKRIEDENIRFREYIIPLYDEMLEIFTKYFWLAEDSTKEFYKPYCRYVEIWHRYLNDAIPPRVLEELKIEEEPLLYFYENLEKHLIKLRNKLAQQG